MKKIDVEKLKEWLNNDFWTEESSVYIDQIELKLDQLSDDKCEECGGFGVDLQPGSAGSLIAIKCPSCRGSGTLSNSVKLLDEDDRNSIPVMGSGIKLDQVLKKIKLAQYWFMAEGDDSFLKAMNILSEITGLRFAMQEGKGKLMVLREIEQRKEELE